MDEDAELVPLVNRCPDCEQQLEVTAMAPFAKITCPHCGSSVRVRTTMGQYQITQLLGEGGMSQVFKAVDMYLGREVALKILHQSLSQDAALTSMFEREAKLTASILHPNVVKVYTVGEEQGYFFIAMELLETNSLEQLIANKGALPEAMVLSIAHDVTSGLRAAYDESLIHRDIKPGNMLVIAEGTTKLVDFGLAVQQGGADESEDLWATPFYVPPEKLDGRQDTYLGDIYSLGATLFHALAGTPPYEANTSSLDELKLIKKQPVDLKSASGGSVSKPTVKLIEKMMAYSPADRHQSYDELLEHIEEIQHRQFGVSKPGRSGAKKRNEKLILGLGVSGVVLAVTGAALLFLSNQGEGPEGGLGISPDERVISVGENTNVEIFLKGRAQMVAGDFKAASETLAKLSDEAAMSPSTRMWAGFFRGTLNLFQGKEEESREWFAEVAKVTTGNETGQEAVMGFIREIAEDLSGPLPVMNAESRFSPDSVEAVGLLAAGLKNWQLGEFESGLRLLEAFAAATPPDEFGWMNGLKEHLGAYRKDMELVKTLPNPSRREGGKLGEDRAQLEAALEKVKSRGAVPVLVKTRLERIDQIKEFAALEKAERDAALASVAPVPDRNEAPPNTTTPGGGNGEGNPAAEKDKELLLEVLESTRDSVDMLLFPTVVAKLQEAAPETDSGKSLQEALVAVYTSAGGFVDALASRLVSETYEGTIRRKEGLPLEAAITSADSTVFSVDLGFGPNEVPVAQFDPAWMIEAAEEVFPEKSPGTITGWEMLVSFAFATGNDEAAERHAAELSAIDPTFAERWATIRRLR